VLQNSLNYNGYYYVDEDDINYLLWRIDSYDVEQRLECVSRRFLGVPYKELDCMMYVEEVMSLTSGAQAFDEYERALSGIRYVDGVERFGMRRHFVSIDWLPENEDLGYIEDISKKIASEELEYTSLEIDRIKWVIEKDNLDFVEKVTAEWDLVTINKDLVEYAVIGYVPLASFYTKCGDEIVPNEKLIKSLPNISIVLFIRPQQNAEKYGAIVAHMGFLMFSKGEDDSRGEPILRHASSRFGMIIDEPFLPYIDSQSRYRAGVTILKVLEHERSPLVGALHYARPDMILRRPYADDEAVRARAFAAGASSVIRKG